MRKTVKYVSNTSRGTNYTHTLTIILQTNLFNISYSTTLRLHQNGLYIHKGLTGLKILFHPYHLPPGKRAKHKAKRGVQIRELKGDHKIYKQNPSVFINEEGSVFYSCQKI